MSRLFRKRKKQLNMLKELSEKQKVLIIFITAFVVVVPLAVFQSKSVAKKISNTDFSNPPFSNMETSPINGELEERMRVFEEGLEERIKKIDEEELKNLEETNNEE